MNILIDIAVNLAAALIGFCLGLLWQTTRKYIRRRQARLFWKPFVNSDMKVVVAKFSTDRLQITTAEFTRYHAFEASGFLAVGDAMGLAELRSYFDTLKLGGVEVSYADSVQGDSLKSNLILIGGPNSNSVSREVLRRLDTKIVFDGIKINDTHNKKVYSALHTGKIESLSNIDRDYGVVIRAPNPFAPNKQVLLIAGSLAYGTWAGIRFAVSKQFMRDTVSSTDSSIECLIETDVLRGTPQHIRLLTSFPHR